MVCSKTWYWKNMSIPFEFTYQVHSAKSNCRTTQYKEICTNIELLPKNRKRRLKQTNTLHMFLGPAWACPKVASDSGLDGGFLPGAAVYSSNYNRLNAKQPRNGRKSDEKTKWQMKNTVATGLTRNSLEMAEKVTKKQNYKLQIQSQQAKLETASIWQKRWRKNKIQNFELSPNRLNSK